MSLSSIECEYVFYIGFDRGFSPLSLVTCETFFNA